MLQTDQRFYPVIFWTLLIYLLIDNLRSLSLVYISFNRVPFNILVLEYDQ